MRLINLVLASHLLALFACAMADDSASPTDALDPLVALLSQVDDADFQLDVLKGIHDAVKGRRRVAMPKAWADAYKKLSQSDNPRIRERTELLAVIFGDRQVRAKLRQLVVDRDADGLRREQALEALVQSQDEAIMSIAQQLIENDEVMRRAALRSLASFDDAKIPQFVLSRYDGFTGREKQDAIGTLISRAGYALVLLDAIERSELPSRDLSAFAARQLRELQNEQVNEKLGRVWGSVRPTATEKRQQINQLKVRISGGDKAEVDIARGRAVFAKQCANCHKLFGEGGSIGPELTGSQRSNLDYLLENLIDPNALIGRDYQMTTVETDGGRVISGLVKFENAKTLTLQTPNEVVIVPIDEIVQRKKSPVSMMPEGLLDKLSVDEVSHLIAYLASPVQVALPTLEAAAP